MKKVYNLIFLYFFVFVMCVGASFAWYVIKGESVSVNINFAGLDPYIKYESTTVNEENKTITPSSDYKGGVNNDITFNKEPEGKNLQLYGHIYLYVSSADEEVFKSSQLKWTLVSVTDNVETEISTGNFVGEQVYKNEITSSSGMIPAYINFSLNESDNTTYKVYVWIDSNAPSNIDISNKNISINIYSEASTESENNGGKYNEIYIREIIYQNSIINSLKLYSSIYQITDYIITNTTDIPSLSSTNWIPVNSTISNTEPGYIATIDNVNQKMDDINNICVKNSNGDIACKLINNYIDDIYLTYDCMTNGGTTANTTETINYGNNVDLTKTCSKSGWTFIGWNTDKNSNDVLESYTMPASDTTLYAIYKKESITYTAYTKKNIDSVVTGDDISVSCTIDAVYNNDKQSSSCNITLPNNPYKFTDWEFNGWVSSNTTTTSDISGSIEGSDLELTSDINLIATWKRDYTATFYTYQLNYTSTCTAYNNDMCTFDLPEIASIEGPFSSSYYGVSTSILDSTVTTTYNSKYLDYYSVYLGTWTVSYIKDNDNVSSIGKTTDTCDVYKYYDGTSYISTTCNVTLPDITPIGGYKVSGWYDYGDSKVGDPSDSISLNSNTNYVAKVVKEYYASHFSYDNSDTEVDCDDVACMLDELYVMSDKTVASHYSYDNTDTEVDCDDVACMLDELYVMSDSTVASHFSYDNSNTGVECSDVACMLDELYVMSDSTVASHFSYDNSNTGVNCSDVACMLDELFVMSDSTVASHFSYDNSNTGVECSDVACMLDELFVMSDSTVASHFSYDNSNTGVECNDVACMLDELYKMTG